MNVTTVSERAQCALLACWLGLVSAAPCASAEEAIDASDPTKIYTYAGAGLKYNEYTNGEYMWEVRATGNIGLGEHDMILFEAGYGWHEGDQAPGSDTGLTDARFRYFHLFDMNYDLERGYRGWGTQLDLQLAGALKGKDGQNVIIVGGMPTFALGGDWNLYLQLNIANTWDKKFAHWNGVGPNVTCQFVFSPDNWWPGAQVQITPSYTYFVAGELENEGSGYIEINVGGQFTPTVMWDITGHKNVDKDLRSLRRGPSSALENDWNIFLNATAYF